MLLLLAFVRSNSQELPPKHRGMHPVLQKDGSVVDENGVQLGFITSEGKVCDVTGAVLGVIAESGDVTSANGKGILGVILKDGSFKSSSGYVVSEQGGMLKFKGKIVGWVDRDYKYRNHACVVHCFFSLENPDASEIDAGNQ